MKWAIVPLVLAASALSAQRSTPRRSTDSTRVVFVCEHGSVKSLVALQYFNRLARERGLPFAAVSRGTHPDAEVPPAVANGLLSDGFELGAFKPRLFTSNDLARNSLVVSFDVDVSQTARKSTVLRWDGMPSVSENYPAASKAIAATVTHLVDSLAYARARKR
jgi:arsenate reductase